MNGGESIIGMSGLRLTLLRLGDVRCLPGELRNYTGR